MERRDLTSLAASQARQSDFDLTGLQAADRTLKRSSLYLVVGGILWLGGILVYIEAWGFHFILSSGLSTSQDQGIVFGGAGLALAVIFSVMLIPSQLPGARRIRIDDVGLRMTFGSGRVKLFAWSDPRTQLVLRDFSSDPAVVRAGTTYSITGVHLWNGQSLLSKEAFDSLLSYARKRGLAVSQSRGSPFWYSVPPVVHSIRGGTGG